MARQPIFVKLDIRPIPIIRIGLPIINSKSPIFWKAKNYNINVKRTQLHNWAKIYVMAILI